MTGSSAAVFSFKIKKKATPGPYQLTFMAQDNNGRVRTAALMLIVQ
jgi:hypothetical protein